ncbi:MAG TPA: hypothetical protein VFP42_09080 [Acidimicrobiia bacterium]|nr:hypothetical protein [Acidimicrobiia bacterium]
MTVVAGVLSILTGLGFGIPGVIGARHLARTGEIWFFLGFPTYAGPFERFGIQISVALITWFVVVCALEVVVGTLLLAGWHPALWLSLFLLPLELVFWLGFALPFGLVFGAARAIAIAIALSGKGV